ncbi:hypothetical protein [Changchengzhania lutea]|uniref:hypothetical protein n=1 Tax=Changchengzhania lutea TaxID=2049305 RepID=UPI0037440F1A
MPVKIEVSYYVDGGALNNFPVETLKADCDAVIGSYVNGYNAIAIIISITLKDIYL